MLIGVTGANGFVGRYLARDLASRGHAVRAISRHPMAELGPGMSWSRSPELGAPAGDWIAALDGIDTLIHAAARVHVMDERSADPLGAFRKANVEGTIAIAHQARAAGVRRLVFVSSIKVNGEATTAATPFSSEDRPAPVDPYGISKLEAEHALLDFSRREGLEVVIVRPVLVYGPGVKANFAKLLSLIDRGVPLSFGGVKNRRSLVFVGNLSDLLIRVAEHPAAAGHTFLVSDGEDLSTSDLAVRLANALGRRARMLTVPVFLLRGLARLLGRRALADRLFGSLTVDITPARARLDWVPPFTVEQGLQETAAWFRATQGR